MKVFFCLCFLLPVCSIGQKSDIVVRYLDADLNTTTKKKAVYPALAVRQQNGWGLYAVYPDTTYVLKAHYRDKALTIKEGPYEVYYMKSSLAVSGFYHDNRRVGSWRTWHENGRLKDSGFLNNNVRMGVWKT